MARLRVFALLAAMTALGVQVSYPSTTPSDQTPSVTFNKNVLPILENNCQVCHRPGDIAPMSFLTYESTRPWAKAIKTAVVEKKMPPWFADPHIGKFRNAQTLTKAEIDTLVAWADTGAREGDAADKPKTAPQWRNSWRIEPDVVVSMPQAFRVAAKGVGEIRVFDLPNPFKEDTWVNSIEIRPGDPAVVHHVIVQVVDMTKEAALRSSIGAGALASIARLNPAQGIVQGGGAYSGVDGLLSKLHELKTGRGSFTTMEAVYAPGSQPMDFRYDDSARLIKGGGQIRMEVHYTPNGSTETMDQTKVGFTVAKSPVNRSFVLMAPDHLVDPRTPIPAGDANWETSGELTFKQDAELVWFMPHMHLRGKDMSFQLIYPNGKVETVLSAKFNFNWQLGYELEEPIKVPKGTRMVVTSHHDNSANNKLNPDPTQHIGWGDLTGQEMMLPWFGVIVPRDAQPDTIAQYSPRDLVVDETLKALDRLIDAGF